MKKKNTKKENKFLIFILIIIIFCLCLFFLIKYITKEIEEYKLYDDYTKANQVMLLSFNKNFDIFFTSIRAILSSNYDKKLSKGDIIFDFANYHMIPILDYMKNPTNNEILITNFSLFTDFLANYNMATIDNRENILIKQKNNTYYVYKNKKYKYSIKKEVISKIKQLKKVAPKNLLISIDGGVNKDTINMCKTAGCDMVVSGSYITNEEDYEKQIESLR